MTERDRFQDLREYAPRVHCITNYVTARDVANAVLAIGGSPIMAQGRREVEDVTSICHSLVLNMGTFEEWTLEAMLLAGKRAMKLKHPIILDPVGVTASDFRRKAALKLLEEIKPTVIRANEAELTVLAKALSGGRAENSCGVDSDLNQSRDRRKQIARRLAEYTGAVTVMTGAEDLIADGSRICIVKNGHPIMGRITGSGCMLDGVLGAFCGADFRKMGDRILEKDGLFQTVVTAVSAYGLCGELAHERGVSAGGGTGSFHMYFTDFLSVLDWETAERGRNIEIQ